MYVTSQKPFALEAGHCVKSLVTAYHEIIQQNKLFEQDLVHFQGVGLEQNHSVPTKDKLDLDPDLPIAHQPARYTNSLNKNTIYCGGKIVKSGKRLKYLVRDTL